MNTDPAASPPASLIYISLACAGTDDAAVQDIIAAARRNNIRLGVTGAMLSYAGYFLQALEGPREVVHALFDDIRLDRRHHEVRLIAFDMLPQRSFDGWAMRHVPSPRAQDRAVTEFLRRLWRDPAPEQMNNALALLARLAQSATAS